MQITLVKPQLFVNLETNATLITLQPMPVQLRQSDNDLLLAISKFFNSSLTSLLISQAGAQIVVSQSLQIFWGFVNTQQLISHLPLLQLSIPSNLYYFFQLVVGSLKFDYLFSTDLLRNSFGLKEDYPAYSENFNFFGYDSSLAIQNMGFNTFILLVSPALVILAFGISYIARQFAR